MTISNVVRMYLKSKPYTLEALDSGIVNYSALSRLMQKQLGIKNYQAVKAAIRRYAEDREVLREGIESRALGILRENRMALLDGVRVIISTGDLGIESDAKVKMDDYYIYLTRKDALKSLDRKARKSLVKVRDSCSAIIIYSEEGIEGASGVIAFLASLLAEQNINVVEFISCYTETIVVVSKEDSLRSYSLLAEVIASH